jgi:CCR4-NOT complex subunit CAF16
MCGPTIDEKATAASTAAVGETTKPVLSVQNLRFKYDKDAETPSIADLNMIVKPNSKVILVGANGAGKSTLIRILTGLIWTDLEFDEFDINGSEKANDQVNGVAYLGERWKRRRTGFEGICPYTVDSAPSEMFKKWQKDHKDRRDELVKVLGINMEWRLNECSDGQRKKVRLLFKLLKPFKLAIIDEFAADLDIFSRNRFLDYLTKECAERGASVVFATHIFDQVDNWATHIAFMQLDKSLSPVLHLKSLPAYQEILARSGADRVMCPMYTLVLEEMERQYRKAKITLEPVVIKENQADDAATANNKPVVTVKNLTFSYNKGQPNIVGLNCIIQPNSKVLLVGANGAGKSTLLRMLNGQIWTGMEYDEFDINGNSKPNDQANGVTYLGGSWKRQRTGFEGVCPYTMDCAASEMFVKWQETYKERRDELVRVLGIDLKWRMHECSDGQRKKVRIMIKLLKPFQACFIDEFAADLDILARSRFFDYLARECEERGAAVIYATHIFDQADSWASHIAFMQLDKVLSPIHPLQNYAPYEEVLARSGSNRAMCPMYVLVLEELEKQYRESGLFVEDYQNVADVVMAEQSQELAGDRFGVAEEKDQNNWVAGRLTVQLKKAEAEKAREERFRKRAIEDANN